MKAKTLFYTLFILSFIFATTSFCQDNIKYGVKGGIGFWRFMSLSGVSKTGKYPKYSYPAGFSVGLFSDYKLSEDFSLVNELLYQNSITKITIYTAIEGILEQKVTSQFIKVPVLLKYNTRWLGDTYFLLGPSFAYLKKANYDFYDQVYRGNEGNVNITKSLPEISTSIEFGLGKYLKVTNINFLIELRTQMGITKFRNENIQEYYEIGSWRNFGLSFFIGLQL